MGERRRSDLLARLREAHQKMKGELNQLPRRPADGQRVRLTHPADCEDSFSDESLRCQRVTTLTARLHSLDAVIGRVERGERIMCEDCGRPIPIERILVAPALERCVRCQSELELEHRRLGRFASV